MTSPYSIDGPANNPRAQKRGQVMILFGLFVTAILVFAALAIDVGWVLAQRRAFQKIAAMCAIESAQLTQFTASGIYDRATACVGNNGLTSTELEYPTSSSFAPQSGAYAGNAAFVEVRLRRAQPTFFGKVVGINTLPVIGRAVAGGITPADFAMMGLQGDLNSSTCSGCPSSTITGSACTRGAFRQPSGNMTIVGIAAANQGFSGGSPTASGGVFSPGPPCLDPNYPLPTPIATLQTMSGSGTLCVTNGSQCDSDDGESPYTIYAGGCPSGTSTVSITDMSYAFVSVNCGSGSGNATVTVQSPRKGVIMRGGNHASVEILGSSADPQTAQVQTVCVSLRYDASPSAGNPPCRNDSGGGGNPTFRLLPGFYDWINVANATQFRNGLYLITTGYKQASGTSVNVTSATNPLNTAQPGVSMVIGLNFTIDTGNSTFNLSSCCATQMSNNIQLYHLGGCAAPYSGSPPSPLASWPSPWTCQNGIVPNVVDWGGNNSTKIFTGSIYQPYLCTDPSFPNSCNNNFPTVNNRPAWNTLPQTQCGTSSSVDTCLKIHGSAGSSITGQLIAPTILFNGNGMGVTWLGGTTTAGGQPYLAE